jgi:hypothetical protein
MASARSSWDAVAGANVVGYDARVHTSSVTISPTIETDRVTDPTIITGSILLGAGYLWIRSVDRNGTVSTFVTDGTNLNTKWAYPAGVFDIAKGGTGASTTGDAVENLLPLYLGNATKYLALNDGGTDVVWTTGSGGGSGTVISVSATGTVNGLTLSGEVTTAGFLTLGGTLTDVSLNTAVTGTLGVNKGGTNANTAENARTNLGLGVADLVSFGNVKSSGSSQFGGTVSVTGNITATGDVSVTGNVNAVGSMSMGSGFLCVGSGVIASGGLSVDGNISAAVITATTRFHSPAAAVEVVTATTRFYSPAASIDVVTATTRFFTTDIIAGTSATPGSVYVEGNYGEVACISAGIPVIRMTGIGSTGGQLEVWSGAVPANRTINITGSTGLLECTDLKFGTFTAAGGLSVTGYITVTDANGNSRKLAVVV